MKNLIGIILLNFCVPYFSYGQEIFVEQQTEFTLKGNVQFLLVHDQISPNQAYSLFSQNKGTLINKHFFKERPLDNSCWLYFNLRNDGNSKRIYFGTDRSDIHFFEVFKVHGRKVDTLMLSGDAKPFSSRLLWVADLSFPIDLKPYETTSILIKIEKRGQLITMNYFLQNENEFYKNTQKTHAFVFFYLGVLCFIAIFNFLLWINAKDMIHLLYLGIIFSNALLVINNSGVGSQYLWSNLLSKNSSLFVFATCINVSMMLFFMIAFLNIKDKSLLHKTVIYLGLLLALLAIASYFVPVGINSISIQLLLALGKLFFFLMTISLLLIIAVIIEQFRKKNPYVRIYAISVSFIVLFGLLLLLPSSSVINIWVRPSYLIPIGNLFELVILAYGLAVRFNNFKKANISLELSLYNIKNEVAQKVIQTQETERRRLAQDLHDDLGGTLSAIKGRIANEFANNDTIKLVEKAIEDLRLVSRNLLPPELENEGLVKSIQHTIERLQKSTEIKFTYITFGKEIRLSEEKELNTYRIISEILNNVIKHSKASSAITQIVFYEENLHVSIEDNGIGIKNTQETLGIGLKNIHSRVEFLKAKMLIDSSEKGTTIIIDIPYL